MYFYHHLEHLIYSHFLENPSCTRIVIFISVLLIYFYFCFIYGNNKIFVYITLSYFSPLFCPKSNTSHKLFGTLLSSLRGTLRDPSLAVCGELPHLLRSCAASHRADVPHYRSPFRMALPLPLPHSDRCSQGRPHPEEIIVKSMLNFCSPSCNRLRFHWGLFLADVSSPSSI